MRLTTALLLTTLISPLAQAELLDEVNDRGELRIAVQADTPPYAFKQAQRLTGFEVELGQALAQELDVRASIIEVPADAVLSGIESGKYDMALNQAKPAATEGSAVDVSQPYSDQALAIPFQKDNPAFESAVTNAMQRIKADGRLTALEEKWLKVPLEVTAEQ